MASYIYIYMIYNQQFDLGLSENWRFTPIIPHSNDEEENDDTPYNNGFFWCPIFEQIHLGVDQSQNHFVMGLDAKTATAGTSIAGCSSTKLP